MKHEAEANDVELPDDKQTRRSSHRSSSDLPYGMDREQLTQYVLEWCWLSDKCPAGVHDAAAILLGEPSLATGFAKIQFDKWLASKQSPSYEQGNYSHDSLRPPMHGHI